MEIKTTEKILWCCLDTDRFKGKSWEPYCLAKDSWLHGFEDFRKYLIAELKKKYEPNTGDYFISIDHVIELLEKHGSKETTHVTDAHQVGSRLWEGRHGEPCHFYKDDKLVEGYWDYVTQLYVEKLEDLTPLTEHQKTFIHEEGKPAPTINSMPGMTFGGKSSGSSE